MTPKYTMFSFFKKEKKKKKKQSNFLYNGKWDTDCFMVFCVCTCHFPYDRRTVWSFQTTAVRNVRYDLESHKAKDTSLSIAWRREARKEEALDDLP